MATSARADILSRALGGTALSSIHKALGPGSRLVHAALIAALVVAPVQAQQAALTIDPAQSGAGAPKMDMAPNGTPVVKIAAPSASGVTGRATSLRNSSATIQAQGNIAIAADSIVNDRTRFTIGQTTTTSSADNPPPGGYATIPVVGGVLNSQTTTTVTEDVLTTDSGPGRIIAGGNMVLETGALLNRYSTLSAGGSLLINGGPGSAASPVVTNLGLVGTRTAETVTESEVWICVDMSGGMCHDYDTVLRTTPPVTTTQPITIAKGLISAGATVSIDARSIDNLTLVGGAAGDYAASAGSGDAAGTALTGAGGAVSATGATGVAVAGVDPTAIALDPVIVPGLTPATIGLALTPLSVQTPGGTPVFALNLGGLFRFAAANANYLVETDPAFAGFGNFLSSDYFLTRLGYDPSRVQRRLGDALYEQQLITNQLVAQTGAARLAGYGDNEAQYRALMDAGVLVAQAFGLAPGVGLSAEQMATLTTSIVLLVEVEVIGPDGKPVKVLAPRVYLARVDRRDINGAAVISGDDLRLRTADALTNSGVIRAETSSVFDMGSIANHGTIDFGAGGFVRTRGDVVSDGVIEGGNLTMQIGGDFRLEPRTSSSTVATSWGAGTKYFGERTTTTVLNRPATMTLTGDLIADVGGVFGVVGSDLSVGGDFTAFAKQGFDIRSAVDSQQTDFAGREGSTRYAGSASSETNRLATIGVGGDATFTTDGAFAVTGGVVDVGGALGIAADTIAVTGVRDVADYEHDAVTKKTGLLSSTKTTTHDEGHDETIVRSTLSGDTITTHSAGNTSIIGSNVVASNGIVMTSGGDMTLGAMAATDSEAHSISTKKSGISLSGDGLFAGVAKSRGETETTSVTHTGSLIGSAEGDVTIDARKDLTISGSQVVGTGTTTLSGTNVTIENVTDTVDTTSVSQSSSFGVSIGAYENVSGAANSVAGLPGRVKDGAAGGAPETAITQHQRRFEPCARSWMR